MVHKNVLRYVIEEIIKLFFRSVSLMYFYTPTDIDEGEKNTDETEKEYQ